MLVSVQRGEIENGAPGLRWCVAAGSDFEEAYLAREVSFQRRLVAVIDKALGVLDRVSAAVSA